MRWLKKVRFGNHRTKTLNNHWKTYHKFQQVHYVRAFYFGIFLQATEDSEEDAPMIAKRGTFNNSLLSCSMLPSLYSFLYMFGLPVSYDLLWATFWSPSTHGDPVQRVILHERTRQVELNYKVLSRWQIPPYMCFPRDTSTQGYHATQRKALPEGLWFNPDRDLFW